MATPLTMRRAPINRARRTIGATMAAGMPAFSICLASVAPQRVPVPQVATTSAACTPSFRMSRTISAPIRSEAFTGVIMPVVT